MALGIAIFLELAGGVLFVLGSPLGSCLLVCLNHLGRSVDWPKQQTKCRARWKPLTDVHSCVMLILKLAVGCSAPSRHAVFRAIMCNAGLSCSIACCTRDLRCTQATFCILVTPIMHNFWTLKEGSQEQLVDMCVLHPPDPAC